jgi:multidrug efflux pump subunit AcrA (membrane-fusion protein)
MKNRIAIYTLISVCGLFALHAAEQKKAVPPKTQGAVKLDNCYIELIDKVTLASDRTGILKQIEFREGDSVTKGVRVALIQDEVAQANLAVAAQKASNETNIKFAENASEKADLDLDRYTKMYEEYKKKQIGDLKPFAEKDIDEARLAAIKAKLSIQQAKHELQVEVLNRNVTAAELETYSVKADFDGVVTKVYRKKGEAVRQGEAVADVVNTDRVRVKGRIPLAQLRLVKQGTKVYVRLSSRNEGLPEQSDVFEGHVMFVDLESNRIDHTTEVFAEVANRENILRAGLLAEMEFEVDAAAEPVKTSLRSDTSRPAATSKSGSNQ